MDPILPSSIFPSPSFLRPLFVSPTRNPQRILHHHIHLLHLNCFLTNYLTNRAPLAVCIRIHNFLKPPFSLLRSLTPQSSATLFHLLLSPLLPFIRWPLFFSPRPSAIVLFQSPLQNSTTNDNCLASSLPLKFPTP